MPDLNDLDRFDEGIPVNPMPASEVRRRGDRMRRRNTVLATVGGVAAAAVFVGLPVAIVANQSGDDDAAPVSPSGSTDVPVNIVTWLQEVARELGAPEGTIKARLSRGRAALAALLSDEPNPGALPEGATSA